MVAAADAELRRRPEFAPGSRWEYNNANYILAGLAIEHATGSSVARQLRRELLDPLELDDVVLQPQERTRTPRRTGTARSRPTNVALCAPAARA